MQLKECPFCGSEAVLEYDKDSIIDGWRWQARCTDSRCVGWHDTWFHTEEEAVEAWNRRA